MIELKLKGYCCEYDKLVVCGTDVEFYIVDSWVGLSAWRFSATTPHTYLIRSEIEVYEIDD